MSARRALRAARRSAAAGRLRQLAAAPARAREHGRRDPPARGHVDRRDDDVGGRPLDQGGRPVEVHAGLERRLRRRVLRRRSRRSCEARAPRAPAAGCAPTRARSASTCCSATSCRCTSTTRTTAKVPRPPTNGRHRPLWANWGFYQQPVPYAYEVHNLEHGAVVIHLGLRIDRAPGTQVLRLWAQSPPYVLIVPGLPADVPRRGVTVTSWQRAMICKTWNARTLTAIRTYRDAYRGAGPEQIPSLNTGAERAGPADARAAEPDRLMSTRPTPPRVRLRPARRAARVRRGRPPAARPRRGALAGRRAGHDRALRAPADAHARARVRRRARS